MNWIMLNANASTLLLRASVLPVSPIPINVVDLRYTMQQTSLIAALFIELHVTVERTYAKRSGEFTEAGKENAVVVHT